jgi:hypothetical protein
VLAPETLLKLRVEVRSHPRVGVSDLTHHPQHVEVVGKQRD